GKDQVEVIAIDKLPKIEIVLHCQYFNLQNKSLEREDRDTEPRKGEDKSSKKSEKSFKS
ncbi:unnamed protein product, partial [Musa textilis]